MKCTIYETVSLNNRVVVVVVVVVVMSKFVPMLNLAPLHEDVRGNGGIAPNIV